ncbi:MAG: DUF4911 domain-containing protein [Desulfobacterales bacterium]|nr:DUF4911 domain-containing protein [Desulfobacterales bacterium]
MSTNHLSAQSTRRYYRADRREISFLRFIFEAYDGLAVFETLDPQAGIICFHIAPGCEDDVEMVLKDLKNDIMLEPAISSKISCLKTQREF